MELSNALDCENKHAGQDPLGGGGGRPSLFPILQTDQSWIYFITNQHTMASPSTVVHVCTRVHALCYQIIFGAGPID